MTARLYFENTALPVLGELGTTPPFSPAQLHQFVDGTAAAPLVDALLLGDDLLQREACLAGELTEPAPAVLARAQALGQEALPDYLDPAAYHGSELMPGDAVWSAYYHHVAAVAARHHSQFVRDWVTLEVGLRNALAVARARALNLDTSGYVVAEELGSDDAAVASLVGEWSAAQDPLDGLRLLLEARWRWVHEQDAWFSFSADEIAAYAVKLLLLHRWARVAPAGGEHGTAQER
jgi:hypothetical protein